MRVEIYDVAGHRIRSVLMPAQCERLEHAAYLRTRRSRRRITEWRVFYRVHAGAEMVTKKMVIARLEVA